MWRLIPIGKRLLSFCIVAAGFALVAYLLFCEQAGRLASRQDGIQVTLAGRAVDCRGIGEDAAHGFYVLEDPTGETYVVTAAGPPAEKALLVIRGIKQTKNGHVVVVEKFRAGTF